MDTSGRDVYRNILIQVCCRVKCFMYPHHLNRRKNFFTGRVTEHWHEQEHREAVKLWSLLLGELPKLPGRSPGHPAVGGPAGPEVLPASATLRHLKNVHLSPIHTEFCMCLYISPGFHSVCVPWNDRLSLFCGVFRPAAGGSSPETFHSTKFVKFQF